MRENSRKPLRPENPLPLSVVTLVRPALTRLENRVTRGQRAVIWRARAATIGRQALTALGEVVTRYRTRDPSPADPQLAAMRAGRLMLEKMAHVARGDSFAFETTLSDRGFSRTIEAWQREGYYITLWLFADKPWALDASTYKQEGAQR